MLALSWLSWGLVLDYRLIGVLGLLLTILRPVLRRRAAESARLSAALACERELRQGTLLICRALETDRRHLQAAVRELTTHIHACPACRKRAARQRPVRPGPSPGGGPATADETAGIVDYAEHWLAKQRERRQPGGGQLA